MATTVVRTSRTNDAGTDDPTGTAEKRSRTNPRHDGTVVVHDVAVLGAGPAGWSAAAACGRLGLSVALIAPDPEMVWLQTYGLWVDQVDVGVRALLGVGADDDTAFTRRWDRVIAVGTKQHEVGRSYAQLSNGWVRDALQTTAELNSALTIRAASVREITHEASSSTFALTKGRPIKARLVLDATGANSHFVARERSTAPIAMQAAFGIIATCDRVPFPSGSAVLMDWRGEKRSDPSFLYALDLGDGRWLLEETSLARTPALDATELERRLHVRLKSLGMHIVSVDETEQVLFPMNVPLPLIGQRTVAIGAAAGTVHPATGYSVAASLRIASRLGTAIVNALEDEKLKAEQRSAAVWNVVWPPDRLKARRLEAYGLGRLLTMGQADTCAFFDTFFSLGPTMGTTYLSGEAGSAELANVMWNVFQKAPFRLRQRLATGNPLTLARSLLN